MKKICLLKKINGQFMHKMQYSFIKDTFLFLIRTNFAKKKNSFIYYRKMLGILT